MALGTYNEVTQNDDDVSSGSFAYDAGSGANRKLAVTLRFKDATSPYVTAVNTPTYNSVNMVEGVTIRYNYAGGRSMWTSIWYLDSPASGSNTFAWSVDQTIDEGISIQLTTFTGCDTGLGSNTGSGSGNDYSPTCTFTTGLATSWIYGGFVHAGATTPVTPDNGETEIDEGETALIAYWGARNSASGGSDTFGGTGDATNRWAIAAIEIKAAAVAAGDSIPYLTKLRKVRQQPMLVR
jgi:hypothetical protein